MVYAYNTHCVKCVRIRSYSGPHFPAFALPTCVSLCVSLLRKAKRKHFEDLSIADVTDNKKFWKRVKPLLGNKIKGNPNIALVESNDLITDEKSLAETFNNYFVNVVSNLGINILDDKSGKGDVSNY